MEDQVVPQEIRWRQIEKSHRRGKVMGGLLIITAGSLYLAKELGAEIPEWLLSWKMLLIALGIVTAVKHKFLHPGWIILVGVGGALVLGDIYPDMRMKPFLWPVLVIMLGLFILFKPRRRKENQMRQYWKKWHEHNHHWRRHHHRDTCFTEPMDYAQEAKETVGKDDFIDSISFMGVTKKNVLSKKFRGGEMVIIFGGAHINLSQADFETTATLDITQVFGGSKLIVPSNWEIRSETITIFGGIEDKRVVHPNLSGEPQRVLILIGTTVFGGIEITSFN